MKKCNIHIVFLYIAIAILIIVASLENIGGGGSAYTFYIPPMKSNSNIYYCFINLNEFEKLQYKLRDTFPDREIYFIYDGQFKIIEITNFWNTLSQMDCDKIDKIISEWHDEMVKKYDNLSISETIYKFMNP